MIRALPILCAFLFGWLVLPPIIESHYEQKFREKEQARRETLKEQMCVHAVKWRESRCWWVDLTKEKQ